MKNKTQRGFTLIELLVVIAIIGILASVVLASLNTARNKGADANIKANLANARAQAELFRDSQTTPTYTGVCTSGTAESIFNLIDAARKTAGVTAALTITSGTASAASATAAVCNVGAGGASWSAAVPLKVKDSSNAQQYYCVDNTGASKTANVNTTTGLCS